MTVLTVSCTQVNNSCEKCVGEEQGRLQGAAEPQGERWQQRGSVQQGWQGGEQGGWRVVRLPYVGQQQWQGEEQPHVRQGALEGPGLLDPEEQLQEWEGEEQPYGRQEDFEGADKPYGRNPDFKGKDQNYKRQQQLMEVRYAPGRHHLSEKVDWSRGQKESLRALIILLQRAAMFRKRYKLPKIQVGWEGAGQSQETLEESKQLCNQEQECARTEQLLDREQKRAAKVSGRKKRGYQQHEANLYAELPQLRYEHLPACEHNLFSLR